MKAHPSKLSAFREQLLSLRDQGVSLRKIAAILKREHGLDVTYNAIFSFLKTQARTTRHPVLFHASFPPDIQDSLIRQFTALWTHDSTAIEGNTLTLGETMKVLELGLTIGGKPLKDHEEVYGHAKAIMLIYDLLNADKMTVDNLFDLHRCVMQKCPIDAQHPVGNWKRDYNGTTGIRDGKPVYMEYATPSDTPALMIRWLKEFNRKLDSASSPVRAINVYTWAHLAFVRIHPFFDGNGRIARLIANLPLLRGGFPPLLIAPEHRAAYMDLLWTYENAVGIIHPADRLLPPHPAIPVFKAFFRREWQASLKLLDAARQLEAKR